jgi:hypothetical protein
MVDGEGSEPTGYLLARHRKDTEDPLTRPKKKLVSRKSLEHPLRWGELMPPGLGPDPSPAISAALMATCASEGLSKRFRQCTRVVNIAQDSAESLQRRATCKTQNREVLIVATPH